MSCRSWFQRQLLGATGLKTCSAPLPWCLRPALGYSMKRNRVSTGHTLTPVL